VVLGSTRKYKGEGRAIPLNSDLLHALKEHAKWYTGRFGTIRPEWYVFPYGELYPKDPTRPMVTLKTASRLAASMFCACRNCCFTRRRFVMSNELVSKHSLPSRLENWVRIFYSFSKNHRYYPHESRPSR
jgi:hypothetical protein